MNKFRVFFGAFLTMLSAFLYAAEPVKYLDENGQEQWISDYSILTGEEDMLTTGWYVVNQPELKGKGVEISGDVRIVLCDNTLYTLGRGNVGFPFEGTGMDSCLRLYAQSTGENAGRLYEDEKDSYYFSSPYFFSVASLVINGGIIDCVGDGRNSPACQVMDFTINGGSFSMSNVERGIACFNMHLNGGQLKVSATEIAVGVGVKLTIEKSYCDIDCECTSFSYYGDDDVVLPDFVSVKVDDKEYNGALPYDFTDCGVTRIISHYDSEAALGVNSNSGDEDAGAWYTMSGMRLKSAPTEKGIYIHNGTKVQIR